MLFMIFRIVPIVPFSYLPFDFIYFINHESSKFSTGPSINCQHKAKNCLCKNRCLLLVFLYLLYTRSLQICLWESPSRFADKKIKNLQSEVNTKNACP